MPSTGPRSHTSGFDMADTTTSSRSYRVASGRVPLARVAGYFKKPLRTVALALN